MRWRPLLVAAAVASGLLGVAFALVPGLGLTVTVPPVPTSVLGTLAVVLALSVAKNRLQSEGDTADVPLVEAVRTPSRPGADFDDRLSTAAASTRRRTAHRDVRDRLRATAIDVLAVTESVPPEVAENMLETGAWTADPYAASLFAEDVPPPLRAVLYGLVGSESRFERQVRHATDELAARMEGP